MENKNHILIVDDDDRIRNLLKDFLSENHYIVSTAENADQAKEELNYIQTNAPASEIDDPLPLKQLLFNKPLWAITVAHFCNNYSTNSENLWTFLFLQNQFFCQFE